VAGTFAAAMAAGAWHIPALEGGQSALSALHQREWVMSVALAGLTFAAGLALQNVRVPSVLSRLGRVSYSVYLGLPLMLDLYDDIPFPKSYQHLPWLQAGASVAFLAALLAFAAMTYYLVEVPFQRLGRRVTMRLDPGLASARSQPVRAEPGPAPSAGTRHAAGPSRDRLRQPATRRRGGTMRRQATMGQSALRCGLGRPRVGRKCQRTRSQLPARDGAWITHCGPLVQALRSRTIRRSRPRRRTGSRWAPRCPARAAPERPGSPSSEASR
jgi:hypothetical protein